MIVIHMINSDLYISQPICYVISKGKLDKTYPGHCIWYHMYILGWSFISYLCFGFSQMLPCFVLFFSTFYMRWHVFYYILFSKQRPISPWLNRCVRVSPPSSPASHPLLLPKSQTRPSMILWQLQAWVPLFERRAFIGFSKKCGSSLTRL